MKSDILNDDVEESSISRLGGGGWIISQSLDLFVVPAPGATAVSIGDHASQFLVDSTSGRASNGGSNALEVPALDFEPGQVSPAAFAIAPESVKLAGSGLVFNNTYGVGVTAEYRANVIAAENYLQSHFSTFGTFSVFFDTKVASGFSADNTSSSYPFTISYSQLRSAVQRMATSSDDLRALSALLALSDPSNGYGFELTSGQARILGVTSATSSSYDDSMYLYTPYWDSSKISANPGDVQAVILHEITEGLFGRFGYLGYGSWVQNSDGSYSATQHSGPMRLMDLFRYTLNGQHDFVGAYGTSAYFSPDGKSFLDTGLVFHTLQSNGTYRGDFFDWDGVLSDSNNHDPFGPGGPGSGDPGSLSTTDLQTLDVLGLTKRPGKVAPSDFNGDGTSDILWRDSGTGGVVDWIEIAGLPWFSNGVGGASSNWIVAGTGDFNNDGTTDILWRDSNTGAVSAWLVGNGVAQSSTGVGGAGNNWTISGIGDFNHDGTKDILWRNTNGDVASWLVSNGVAFASTNVGYAPLNWQIAGTGDFNADGTADILWRDSNTGAISDWIVSNGVATISHGLGSVTSNWKIVGTGDFDGNGTTDILWRDSNTGAVSDWLMSNGVATASRNVGAASLNWQIIGIADYTGDGTADILWRDSNTGAVADWIVTNGVATSSNNLGSISSNWKMIG